MCRGAKNDFTELTTSARVESQIGKVFTRPFNHLLHSSSQLDTNDVGHTMSARFTVGVPSIPCRNNVHNNVIPCKVLPKPISSARIHPHPSKSRKPMTHSNIN